MAYKQWKLGMLKAAFFKSSEMCLSVVAVVFSNIKKMKRFLVFKSLIEKLFG